MIPGIAVKTGGATRLVILTRRWAIKLPAFHNFIYGEGFRERATNCWRGILSGLSANMQEKEFARGIGGDKLMPVSLGLWGGFLNVMPRGDDLTRDTWVGFDYHDFVDCTSWTVPAEHKMCSFKHWKGRIVCVDYG